jgi:mediator of RNA polymerase II transcription subunit 7
MDSWPPVPAYVRLFAATSQWAPPAPPPPVEGEYDMFGVRYSTEPAVPTLQSAGVQQLTDGVSARDDLRKLIRSLLVHYTELVQGVVGGEHGLTESRLAAIETIFLNMHFIVNSHRPQQAVDTAAAMVRRETERLRALAAELETACDAAEALLDREPAAKRAKE